MTLINSVMIMILLIILPVVIGSIWAIFLKREDKFKLLVQMWLYGTITMFAITQLVVVPLIANRMKFSVYVKMWCVICIILVIFAVAYIIRLIKKSNFKNLFTKLKTKQFNIKKLNWYVAILAIAAAGIILFQGYFTSKYEHSDDDDSRFVVLEVMAYEDDVMLIESPINGEVVNWKLGEVKKDLTSPWSMHVALLSELSGVHPAIMSHKVIPLVFVLLCYGALFLVAYNLFKGNYEKIYVFLILISMLNIFGYSSTHTVASMLLLRLWQGKAVFASIIIPAILGIMCEALDDYKRKIWYVLLLLSCLAACLSSGAGTIMSAILIGIFGIIILIKHRSIKYTFLTWCTMIPSGVYCICYYLWNIVFRLE